MTYYKFAEQQADSTVDWSVISKNLTDTINQIDKDRKEKKAALDTQLQEDLQRLTDVPAGENKTASEFALRFGDQMTQYRLMINRMLKSGQMSLADYKIAQQNSKASTDQVFGLVDEYNAATKTIMERKREGVNSVSELQLAAQNQSLGNIANTSFWINPTTGTVGLATVEKGIDGVNKMGSNYVSPNVLRQRLNTTVDRFDANAYLAEQAKGLAEFKTANIDKLKNFNRTGLITSIEDPQLRKEYEQWENNTVGAVVGDGFKMLSLLTDSMPDKSYAATYDKEAWENDKTGKLVLVEADDNGILTPKLTDKQKEDAKKYLKNNIKNYVTNVKDYETFGEQPIQYKPQYLYEYERADADEKSEIESTMNNLGKLYYGNETEAVAAGTYFRDYLNSFDEYANNPVVDVTRNGNAVVVTQKDGSRKDFLFKAGGKTISQKDFIEQAEGLHKIKDIRRALKSSGYDASKGFNPNVNISVKMSTGMNDALTAFNAKASATTGDKDNKKRVKFITPGNASTTASTLNNEFNELGFSFEPFQKGKDKGVRIKYNNKAISTVGVGNDGDDMTRSENKIRVFMRNALSRDISEQEEKDKKEGVSTSETTSNSTGDLSGISTSGFNKKK
jgi:hypothetical protein